MLNSHIRTSSAPPWPLLLLRGVSVALICRSRLSWVLAVATPSFLPPSPLPCSLPSLLLLHFTYVLVYSSLPCKTPPYGVEAWQHTPSRRFSKFFFFFMSTAGRLRRNKAPMYSLIRKFIVEAFRKPAVLPASFWNRYVRLGKTQRVCVCVFSFVKCHVIRYLFFCLLLVRWRKQCFGGGL